MATKTKPRPTAKRPAAKVRPLKGGRLEPYHKKRDFTVTPEPTASAPSPKGNMFVVQKHAATRLHYDFRLEVGGVLKSWAVTKVPTLDPAVKRLAVHVEDHPVSYGDFEGTIPERQYGAGTVIVWDRGTWTPRGDVEEGLRKGELKFRVFGTKLKGGFVLVKLRGRDASRGTRASGATEQRNWLLIKEKDEYARPGSGDALAEEAPESAKSGLTLEELAAAAVVEKSERAPAKKKLKQIDPATLPKAKKAPLPDVPEPQLAVLADDPPAGGGWIHEIKYDGYRTMTRIDNGDAQDARSPRDVRMFTRNQHDWTERYQPIADALAKLPVKSAVIDGEVAVQSANGSTSFAALQDALAIGAADKLVYFVFDLLYLDGYDLRKTPLRERKRALEGLISAIAADDGAVHYSEHFEGEGADFLSQALRMGLEGIISKRADSPYESVRSRAWMKVKGAATHEFAIVGYTESKAAGGLSALLLAETAADGLQYVGKVGTGFTSTTAKDLQARLAPLQRKQAVFTLKINEKVPGARWVEPTLFAEVEYANKTADGHLRAARFRGLRHNTNQPPWNEPPPAKGARPVAQVTDQALAEVFITNPDRRMFSADGPTKLDLAMYYAKVGDWILPHIANRPLTLIRSPSGKVTDRFYQRHIRPGMPDDVKRVDLSLPDDKEREEYLYITDVKGLLGLVQFGVVEIHPWGSKVDKPERPDRMVFDLDPDEGLEWRTVVAAAFEVRDFVKELGLVPFTRTTGGKGIHVVVPIERQSTWDEFKEFSHLVVQALAAAAPQRYTANMAKKERKGRIFIDYLRNARMATAIGSYSLRARTGCPVATPLTWEELKGLDDAKVFDWRTVPERLRTIENDPWAGIEESARRLTRTMEGSLRKLVKK